MIARKRAFAVAYVTPGPTFHNATESYLAAVEPDANRRAANLGGRRYMQDPFVQQHIVDAGETVQLAAGMTTQEFAEHCFEMEDRLMALAERGIHGAPQAAARYAEQAGKALGLFVQLKRDLTPPTQKGLPVPTSRGELSALHEQLGRMLELTQANPLPPGQQEESLPAGPKAEDIDYEIEDASSTQGERPESSGAPAATSG